MTSTMKATVFEGKNRIAPKSKPVPKPGYNEALVRIALTTICGTDLHIVRGEYPVQPGLTIGHEPVAGVIEELGPGITGYKSGTRVLIGAITPCGQCELCLSGRWGTVWRASWRMEIRKHDRWVPGRVCARAKRSGESRNDTGHALE